jgi:hypothetical protein
MHFVKPYLPPPMVWPSLVCGRRNLVGIVGIATEKIAESSMAKRRVVRYIVTARIEWQETTRYLSK